MIRSFYCLALAMTVVIGFASHSGADGFWSDYQTARSTFLTGESDAAKYYERAFEKILDGIDGRWTSISALDQQIGDYAALEKACGFLVFEAKRTSEFSFLFTRRSGKDLKSTLEYRYTPIGGNLFAFSADDRAVLKYFAVDNADVMPVAKLNMLRASNGLAELYHQGPDLLILKSILGAPNMYARCK